MQIISRIAGIIGIASLGVIAAEVINNTAWLVFRVPVAYFVVPLVALYFFYEFTIYLIRQKTDREEPAGKAVRVMLGTTRSIYLILGIIALLSIPLLWWGVIKRLAAMAGEGKIF